MIAARLPGPLFRLGQRVRLDWPANLYHGARGVVETLDGDWVGVTWSLHGDTFYVPMPARRLRAAGGGRS